jgi:hypothetical protein
VAVPFSSPRLRILAMGRGSLWTGGPNFARALNLLAMGGPWVTHVGLGGSKLGGTKAAVQAAERPERLA